MKRFSLILSAILFPLVMNSSPSHSEPWVYWGWGVGSCADVIKDTQENNGSYPMLDTLAVSSWIMGYISGRNEQSGTEMVSKTDIDGIIFELIKRCKAEPMSEILDELDWIYKNKLQ